MTTDIEALAEVLVRHQRVPTFNGHYVNRCCGCDHLHGESDGPNSPRHVAHQVEELLASDAFRALVAGERAEHGYLAEDWWVFG